jgi:hypothetical protein
MRVVSRIITEINELGCHAINYFHHKVMNIDNHDTIVRVKKDMDASIIGIRDLTEEPAFVGEEQMDYDIDVIKAVFVAVPNAGIVVGLYEKENLQPSFDIHRAVSYIGEVYNMSTEIIQDPIAWYESKFSMSLENNDFECFQLGKRVNAL